MRAGRLAPPPAEDSEEEEEDEEFLGRAVLGGGLLGAGRLELDSGDWLVGRSRARGGAGSATLTTCAAAVAALALELERPIRTPTPIASSSTPTPAITATAPLAGGSPRVAAARHRCRCAARAQTRERPPQSASADRRQHAAQLGPAGAALQAVTLVGRLRGTAGGAQAATAGGGVLSIGCWTEGPPRSERTACRAGLPAGETTCGRCL